MTVNILARFRCATETIEAVDFDHHFGGGYHYGVRFYGGRHAGVVIRCHNEQSALRLFTEAMNARRFNKPLWWLDVAAPAPGHITKRQSA